MDAYIDPATCDYRLSGGNFVRDPADGLANAVYLRLMTPLGSYWADPLMGSRLHELLRDKDVLRASRLAQQYAEQALKPLLTDGRVQSMTVSAARQNGHLLLTVTLTSGTGKVTTFQHPVKIAG